MGLMRRLLLAGSQSRWLRERAMTKAFVRRAVSRFMPGEKIDDALAAAAAVHPLGIRSVLTRLGENVTDWSEADAVARHYHEVLERVPAGAEAEISIKLTQLGLDLDKERCYAHVRELAEQAQKRGNFVWIDMEQSSYTDVTLEILRRARAERPNVGVCVQSYLYRTEKDVTALLPTGTGVRLVKGAYAEPPDVAFPKKADVDANYLKLAHLLLGDEARRHGVRAVFGTHDGKIIRALEAHVQKNGTSSPAPLEFHLLYGIRRPEQERLARGGHRVSVLISYGSYWFPWYMRRLAERPANVLFVAKSLIGG
jgi:proline dehydrogenase